MTYVPPERDDDGDALDQTRQLSTSPALPAVGDGLAGGRTAAYHPDASPTVPFPADGGGTDPTPEEPGPRRDRLTFQLVWEAVLVLLTLNALFLVYQRRDAIFGGEFDPLRGALDAELHRLAPLLLVASAFALTLRLGAVNLAVPALTYLVLSVPNLFVTSEPLIGLGMTAAAAAVLTALFAVLSLAFRVPAWMAGLASAIVLAASLEPLRRLAGEIGFHNVNGWSAPEGLYLAAGAAALSIAGGLLGLLPGIRERFTTVKGAIAGTGPRDAASVLTLIGGTFLALFLAGSAGFVTAVFHQADAEAPPSLTGLFTTSGAFVLISPIVFIAVLLGGTSLWGRRGGVAGTFLATVLLWSVMLLWSNLDAPASDEQLYARWSGAVFAGLLLVGLLVSFGLDRLGRPRPEPPSAQAEPESAEDFQTFESRPNLFEPDHEVRPR